MTEGTADRRRRAFGRNGGHRLRDSSLDRFRQVALPPEHCEWLDVPQINPFGSTAERDARIPMDAQSFKEVMARVAAPVAVVTASEAGRPYGTTVSALASLSLSPAMITVALDNASVLLDTVRRTGTFGVNILSADQSETALCFAGSRDARFAGTAWEFVNELPRLTGTSAWLECRVAGEFRGGDHTLLFGAVRDCATTEREPLVYTGRTFGTHVCLPSLAEATDHQRVTSSMATESLRPL